MVLILDELLRKEAIPRETYTQVNNILGESLGDTKEKEVDMGNEEDEVKKPLTLLLNTLFNRIRKN